MSLSRVNWPTARILVLSSVVLGTLAVASCMEPIAQRPRDNRVAIAQKAKTGHAVREKQLAVKVEPHVTREQRVAAVAAKIAGELATICPVADAADQAAFDACRKAMFGRSELRKRFSDFTLWGRQNKDPTKGIKDTNLTQFAPNVLTGLYLPLFMFDGTYEVEYSDTEKLYRVELGAVFRNRLKPGQFPYPFWHDDEKWTTYQDANALILWFDPGPRIRVAQFSPRGTLRAQTEAEHVHQAAFDGRWMWTDERGEVQPKVTLFDGLFKSDNPFLGALDTSYKQLALSLREGQCLGCHVPDNPNKMKRLVLLQTPAHAAAEISRVMHAVRKDRMPLGELTGAEEPLEKERKDALLQRAQSFEAVVEAARAWEAKSTAAREGAIEPAFAERR